MKTRQLLITSLLMSMILSACSVSGNTSIETPVVNVTADVTNLEFTQEDLTTTYNTSTVMTITMDGTKAHSDADSVRIDGSTITILDEGDYLFTGTLEDGRIIVSAEDTDNVHLIFDNVDITNSIGSPLVILQADKTILTLAEGSENTLTDAQIYVQTSDEPNATIFSEDDLTINGSGSLTVYGNHNHGIFSKNDLKIIDAKLEVYAQNDGIKGKDSIQIRDGNLTITANGDGIQSNNVESTEVGSIKIESGTFDIKAGLDGIQAENTLEISGGTFNIITGEQASSEESGKGLKATNSLIITGGIFSIDSQDDSIHSNGLVEISGGELTLASGDDGIHADAILNIIGGTIDIIDSYEGIESAQITVSGGETSINAYDDGLNTSNGNDGSAGATQKGGGDMFASDGSGATIRGGLLVVNSGGDGLDVNGSLSMSAGTVIVFGPTSSANGAIDHSSFSLTGGTLIAVGSSGMAQQASESTQNSVLINFSGVTEGEILSIVDGTGNALISIQVPKIVTSIVYSSADLIDGEYTLVANGSLTGSFDDTILVDSPITGGTTLETFTISSALTTVGDTGMGGGMGGGPRPNRN